VVSAACALRVACGGKIAASNNQNWHGMATGSSINGEKAILCA